MSLKAKLANQLTPRQLQLLKAIRVFQASRCYSPTIAELASELGISRSTTFEHITELRKKDLLSASPAAARSSNLTSKAQKLLNGLNNDSPDPCSQPPAGIPLAGKVAAGAPIEAIENLESLSLNSYFGNSDDIFALEVKGDSMTGDGIIDGDFVICRKCSTADNGQLVIAIVDNENATLKRFYKEKSLARL
ncbi:MAG: transcriptional repressor LexA, partial [Sedimentisphaerales bacterium]|nr:transcriptional repressor LexA [Sedimentisphaerales bacterium]